MSSIAVIERIGRQGDGAATVDGQTVHVPFTLPGEGVEIGDRGETLANARPVTVSPERVEPVCWHFGLCGGCQLQHWAQTPYLDWKRDLVIDALRREGLEAEVGPVTGFGLHTRRRVVFTAMLSPRGTLFGFSQRGSNKIVDLKECPVLLPTIEKSIPSLRQLAAILSPRRGTMKLSVIACSNGLDIAASNGVFTAEPARSKAASLAIAEGWARLTLNGDTLIEAQRPLLACGIALVTPPPQAFVQAVAAAEESMAQLVCGHLAGARHCADLFSGFGAFALRLAVNSTVLAVESSAPALAALDRAWRETGGRLKAVSTLRRDLFSAPLTAAEMKKIDGVVFDPPRAGAEAQAHEIARSAAPLVAAVSCNPVTLARDLKILHDGGYRIERVTPLDQFTHTPHVEAVALLRRRGASA